MAALKSEPPGVFKKILERRGYVVIDEDVYNWIFADKDDADAVPFVVPKLGDVVDTEVMMSILHHAKMDNRDYFLLRDQVLAEIPEEPAN